jgi:hypothetical protein
MVPASSTPLFKTMANLEAFHLLMHTVLTYGHRRQDGGSTLIPDSGSTWSKSLYACASAVKATVKTVSFTYNGTQELLTNLVISDI